MNVDEMINACDNYMTCDNSRMIEDAYMAIGLNFIHYKNVYNVYGNMEIDYSDESFDDIVADLTNIAEIYVRRERNQVFYKTCSVACNHCTGDNAYTARITTRCNRDCFFCFVPDEDDNLEVISNNAIVEDFLRKKKKNRSIESFAISGGEPLIVIDKTVDLFHEIREIEGDGIYLRLYTNADYIEENALDKLQRVGLNEMRISVKPNEHLDSKKIQLIKKYIPKVVIELPVLPDAEDELFALLDELEKTDIDGLNLVELFINGHNCEIFKQHKYTILMADDVRNIGCAEFPFEYPIAESLPLSKRALKYVASKQYHYFVNLCNQYTKQKQYYYHNVHNNSLDLGKEIFDSDGNLLVLCIYSDFDEARRYLFENNIIYRENYNNNDLQSIQVSAFYANDFELNCDSSILSISEGRPVWCKVNSVKNVCTNNSKIRGLKELIMNYKRKTK